MHAKEQGERPLRKRANSGTNSATDSDCFPVCPARIHHPQELPAHCSEFAQGAAPQHLLRIGLPIQAELEACPTTHARIGTISGGRQPNGVCLDSTQPGMTLATTFANMARLRLTIARSWPNSKRFGRTRPKLHRDWQAGAQQVPEIGCGEQAKCNFATTLESCRPCQVRWAPGCMERQPLNNLW